MVLGIMNICKKWKQSFTTGLFVLHCFEDFFIKWQKTGFERKKNKTKNFPSISNNDQPEAFGLFAYTGNYSSMRGRCSEIFRWCRIFCGIICPVALRNIILNLFKNQNHTIPVNFDFDFALLREVLVNTKGVLSSLHHSLFPRLKSLSFSSDSFFLSHFVHSHLSM